MRHCLLCLTAIGLLAGCATSQDYATYVSAQSEAIKLASDTQKPLFRMTAQPGQPITGLATLEVFMPTTPQAIQQMRPNEWVSVIDKGVGVLGAVLGIKYAGEAAANLADNVGKHSTAGYASVQAPQANVSTVTNNTTTDASNRSVITDASNRSTTDASNRSTTDASNRSVTTDASNNSVTGAVSTITDSYSPTTNNTLPATP